MRDSNSQLEPIIDGLIASGQLEIVENVNWRPRDGYLHCTLRANHPDHSDLRLELNKNPKFQSSAFN